MKRISKKCDNYMRKSVNQECISRKYVRKHYQILKKIDINFKKLKVHFGIDFLFSPTRIFE